MSSFVLKTIAVISMLIDHVGYALFPSKSVFRWIGRLAMPIFAFQVAKGFQKTKSTVFYLLRMFLFALISQIPFTLLMLSRKITKPTSLMELIQKAFQSKLSLNIGFTFLIALIILSFMKMGKEKKWFYGLAIFVFLASFWIPMDYGWFGVSLVLIFYYFGENPFLYTTLSSFLCLLYSVLPLFSSPPEKIRYIQLGMLCAFPLFYLHNGQKGKNIKYFFYVFYPLHMLLIVWIKLFILS